VDAWMRGVSTGFDENLYFHYQCQVPWERSTMNLSMPSTKASKFASPNDSCHTSLAASNCQTAVAMCLKLPCRKEVVRPRTAGLVGEEKRSRKCNVSWFSFFVSDHLSPKSPTWIHRRKRSTLVCFLGSAERSFGEGSNPGSIPFPWREWSTATHQLQQGNGYTGLRVC
jgi:hypothetical protein